MFDPTLPDRQMFAQDPGGYSLSAWLRWAMLAEADGETVDPSIFPSSEALKNPVLWLTQAEAMTQAASVLIKNEPKFENFPLTMHGICDAQYCAVALMLVGYSLEICLKGLILIRDGTDSYTDAEGAYRHHELHKLAGSILELSPKDLAILKLLTHFIYWAGRYPDPGKKSIGKHEEIFTLAEQHQISAGNLFKLASRVMVQVKHLTL